MNHTKFHSSPFNSHLYDPFPWTCLHDLHTQSYMHKHHLSSPAPSHFIELPDSVSILTIALRARPYELDVLIPFGAQKIDKEICCR